jgi:hypothetical protein
VIDGIDGCVIIDPSAETIREYASAASIWATRRARAIMDQSDTGRIAALLDDFNTVALPQ